MGSRHEGRSGTDEAFWRIVESMAAEGDDADRSRVRVRHARHVRRVRLAMCASVVLSVGVAGALFRVHVAFGLAWLYLGAPALVFATVVPVDRTFGRRRRRRQGRPKAQITV